MAKAGRVFLRGMTSETYGLKEFRRRQLVALPPRGSNHGHGHQNEAAFYILEGAGFEIHDGQRYDAQNRLFKLLGYDRVVYLEDASEHGDRVRTATVSR